MTDWAQPLRRHIEVELADALPDLPAKTAREISKRVTKLVIVVLMRDGYTVGMAGKALGYAKSTLTGWRHEDKGWARAVDEARDTQRRWLIGTLRAILDANGGEGADNLKGVGQAINVLSNLWFPELRESKVEATIGERPEPGKSRTKILALVNKGA
jgi:hypothetical protein